MEPDLLSPAPSDLSFDHTDLFFTATTAMPHHWWQTNININLGGWGRREIYDAPSSYFPLCRQIKNFIQGWRKENCSWSINRIKHICYRYIDTTERCYQVMLDLCWLNCDIGMFPRVSHLVDVSSIHVFPAFETHRIWDTGCRCKTNVRQKIKHFIQFFYKYDEVVIQYFALASPFSLSS